MSKGLFQNKDGIVFVEFLFVVLPFMAIVLGLAQLALLYVGGLAVQRSASTAARAAIVVLDDDPSYYDGELRNTLSPERRLAIEAAAAFPLYALKSALSGGGDSLESALDASAFNPLGNGNSRGPVLSGLSVSFPEIASANGARTTVRVRYRFACLVPFARAFMCDNGSYELSAESTLVNHLAQYNYGEWADDIQ